MNVLFATHSPPHYIPPPRICAEQVVVGPLQVDHVERGLVKSLKTELGEFDLAALVKRLPRHQKPDFIFVRADAKAQCMPTHFDGVGCPVILVVGDTHHGTNPIVDLVEYAVRQPFAATVIDYTRQHAHFFVEAGVKNVRWLPGFNIQRVPVTEGLEKQFSITFVGQVAQFHQRRHMVCEALHGASLGFVVRQNIYGKDARDIHFASRVNLNCSLNGDLNMRVFEVLQSRGALLTDRLAPEAGLGDLFQDGRDLVLYDSTQDCVARARELLADGALCEKIARAGKARYEEILAPERLATDAVRLIQDGAEKPEFRLSLDHRTRLIQSTGFTKDLRERINMYEIVQEYHRLTESVPIVASPNIEPALLADLVDLPRVRLSRLPNETAGLERATVEQLALAGVDGRIEVAQGKPSSPESALLVRTVDLSSQTVLDFLHINPKATILIHGTVGAPEKKAIKKLGYRAQANPKILCRS